MMITEAAGLAQCMIDIQAHHQRPACLVSWKATVAFPVAQESVRFGPSWIPDHGSTGRSGDGFHLPYRRKDELCSFLSSEGM